MEKLERKIKSMEKWKNDGKAKQWWMVWLLTLEIEEGNEGQRRKKKRAMMSWMRWDPLDYLFIWHSFNFYFWLRSLGPIPATTVFMDWMIKSTARGVWIKRLSTVQPQSNDTLYFTSIFISSTSKFNANKIK